MIVDNEDKLPTHQKSDHFQKFQNLLKFHKYDMLRTKDPKVHSNSLVGVVP